MPARIASSMICAVLLLAPICTSDVLANAYVEGFDWHADDPLLYEDLVVEGIISGIEFKHIDSKVISPFFSNPEMSIGVLQLADARALRGARMQLPINVEIFFDWRNIVGRRVIVCARWWPALNAYLVRDEKSVIVETNAGWERMEPKESLSKDQLTSLVSQMEPAEIARRADLVLSGRVSLLQDSTVVEGTKPRGRVTKVAMDHLEILAGGTYENIVFNTYDWVARIPTMKVGERWVVFLERKHEVWWVIAGTNGLLKEEDENVLLFGGRAPLSVSKPHLVRLVKEARALDH